MFWFIIVLFMSCPWVVSGQYLLPATSLNPLGTNVFSHSSPDPFSGQANPAAVCRINSSFGIIAEQKFLLRELSFVGFSLGLSNNNSGAGLYFNHAGDFLNFQSSGGLLLARNLGKISVGIGIARHQWKTAGYGSQVEYAGAAGCLFELSPKCVIGLAASPVMVSHASQQGFIPVARKFGWGIGYDFSDEVHVSAVLEKTEGGETCWKGAVHYKAVMMRAAICLGLQQAGIFLLALSLFLSQCIRF
jgi:hypothetical protein